MCADENALVRLAKKIDECIRSELPSQFDNAEKEQDNILAALQSPKLNITDKANVVGVAVGYHYRKGRRTDEIGPVVYVSQKLPKSKLNEDDIIPKTILVSGKKHRVDVLETGPVILTCELGIPDTQHATFNPIPPGVAICALDPVTLAINAQGSGGAIVQQAQSQALFLLTCDHVVSTGATLGQPWTNRAVGGHVATAANLDASVCEINNPEPAIHCLGPLRQPIPPLVGLAVKKSGARTGITGSILIGRAAFPGVPGLTVVIDNDAQVPPNVGGAFISNYTGPGDSGSLTVVGNPSNPNDFGPTGNSIIDTIVSLAPGQFKSLIRLFLTVRLTNAAISLNFAIRGNGPGGAPPRLALSHPIQAVLNDFPGNPLRLV